MTSYIREQSAGGIIRGSFRIYGKSFLSIFLVYLLPILPFAIAQQYAATSGEAGLSFILILIMIPLGYLLSAAITVAVSDVCLGNKPTILRSYGRAFGKRTAGLLGTFLLTVIIVLVGYLLLIVPGVIFAIWLMFAIPVVVLEQTWGIKALKRSKALGKGFYLRNFGVFFLLNLVVQMIGFIVGFIVGFILAVTEMLWLGALIVAIVSQILAPIPLVGLVLMYYDMRVRKEGYDTTVLAEDLRR